MLKSFYSKFHPKIESAEADDERINEERHLGDDPKTGKPIFAKIGRYRLHLFNWEIMKMRINDLYPSQKV